MCSRKPLRAAHRLRAGVRGSSAWQQDWLGFFSRYCYCYMRTSTDCFLNADFYLVTSHLEKSSCEGILGI
eukprot:6483761-Amphidinium_carterae.1